MADLGRMWRPSPSPEESWSDDAGANENGEWPVKAVVGEEVRLDGTLRYEVRWENWQRADGTDTTWEKDDFQRAVLSPWERKQRRLRATLADLSSDMEVRWRYNAIHKRFTEHRQQAYDEKLERKRRTNSQTIDWDAELETAYRKLQEPERGESNSKLRMRRSNQASATGSSASTYAQSIPMGKRSSPALTTSSRDLSISTGPAPTRRRTRLRIDSTSPKSTITISSTFSPRASAASTHSSAGPSKGPEKLPSVTISHLTVRSSISSRWNKAARATGAAMVRISPDIPDENILRNLRKFIYMETGYVFGDDDLKEVFNVLPGAFTRCHCMTCSDESACSCRDLTTVYDLHGSASLSVYSKGLFTFNIPRGVDVIECNKYCRCDDECENRVAQQPRDIRLEVFDTKRCGWGVRALDDIPRGKVLGTYAGRLIRRDDVDRLPEEHQGYLFDLDSTEVRNSGNLGGRYTVDAYECGNWTRFVNHSCSPNMQVYCVVYDTIPYVNMPYVAFAASTDIPEGTELTLDYHPYAEEDKKGKRPVSAEECRCGSAECRGWFEM